MLFLFLAGALSSLIGSLIGLGGGFILVPVLTMLMHFGMKDAVFFSLSAVFLLSVLQNILNKELIRAHRRMLWRLSLFAILGSVMASWIGARSDDQSLEIAFGLTLIFFGLLFVRSNGLPLEKIPKTMLEYTSMVLLFVAGIISGFFGIGGGIITVPVLHKVLRFDMNQSAKLSFFVQFFTTGSGLLVHYHSRREQISDEPISSLLILLIGSVIGFVLSRRIKVSNENLKRLFAIALIGIGVWRIYKSLA